MGRKIRTTRLTEEQQEQAWNLFLTTHDNRDKIIAEKLNARTNDISDFIKAKLDAHMYKINNR